LRPAAASLHSLQPDNRARQHPRLMVHTARTLRLTPQPAPR
jgi:hypothetical protein